MSGITKQRHKRSTYACTKCHKSKMKCDIMTHGMPCSRCKASANAKCELYPSKRHYGRQVPLPPVRSWSQDPRDVSQPVHEIERESQSLSIVKSPLAPQLNAVASGLQQTRRIEHFANGQPHKDDFGGILLDGISVAGTPSPSAFDRLLNSVQSTYMETTTGAQHQGSAMVLSLAREGIDRDILELFIDHAQKRRPVDKDTLVFVGESSPLSMLIRHLQDSGHIRMNHPSEPRSHVNSLNNSTSSRTSSVTDTLRPEVLEELFSSYFQIVHPFYPLINRRWFADRYANSDIPPLLLNAVCFVACYHCEVSVIFQAGFSTREEAKEAFYGEAKRLFDDDQEEDYLIVLQAVVLLSFYGGKPRKVWNNRSWLAIAVTISEDLGLHRSTSRLKMSETDKSHLRIIWWCIVFRDLMTSFNWGRPPRTLESRLDFDMLTLKDLEIDEDPENPIFGNRDIANCHFLVENAKLNLLMMNVISARYSPRLCIEPTTNLTELHAELMEWRRNLPKCLDWDVDQTKLAAKYTSMTYHHVMIFIFRPRMVDSEIVEACSLKQALDSASEIASLVGALAILGTMKTPQDIYPIIATAVAVLMSDVRSSNSTVSKLGLQICLMTLNQAKENWDHAPWMVKVFGRLLETGQPESTKGMSPSEVPHTEDLDLLASLFTPMERSMS